MAQKKNKQFRKNPEVRDIVKYCMKFRLSAKEMLEKLAESGYEMDVRTLRRIKKGLPKPERLDKVIENESSSFVLETIEKLKNVEKQADHIITNTKNDSIKLQALYMIPKIRKDIAEFYDSMPVIAALLRTLNEDDTMEKH